MPFTARLAALATARANLNALGLRLPDELMDLQSDPDRQTVGQHPFHELARIDKDIVGSTARGILAKRGRKDDRGHSLHQPMPLREVAGKLIVGTIGKHELDFVTRIERRQILQAKRVSLAGMRA